MTNLSVDNFINKRDAAEQFNRSHRSLSRDITTALKLRDAQVLQHYRLQTQDGQVREGTEVTIEILDTLRDAGQVPTWWADPEYLRERYGRRGEEPEQPMATDAVAPSPTLVSEPPSQSEASVSSTSPAPGNVEQLLLEQISDLKSDKLYLQKELERSYELRKEDNDLREQNNQLMQQLYGLLNSMQQTPGNTYVLNQGSDAQPARPESLIDTPAKTTKPKAQTSHSKPKKTTSPLKKKRAPRKKKTPPTPTEKYLPTFTRMFSRSK